MGGRSIRREPLVLTISNVLREIVARAGWLTYLNRLQESNEAVAIEFLQNLQEDHSTVRGKHIVVTDDVYPTAEQLGRANFHNRWKIDHTIPET